MPRQTSIGTCIFCQGTFSKGTMTRHLSACKQRQAALQAAATRETGRPTKILHLLVDGYGPYWLHLEVWADARLDTLDTFLRNIWLECCGHMSQFCINAEDYVSDAARELGARSMNVPLEKVLAPGMTCTYEYDFGTTTEIKLRVLAERLGARQREAVQILARNNPPVFPVWCAVRRRRRSARSASTRTRAGCAMPVHPSTRVGMRCAYPWSIPHGWACVAMQGRGVRA